jgi:hypothetical protein
MWYTCPACAKGAVSDYEGLREPGKCDVCGREVRCSVCRECKKKSCHPCMQEWYLKDLKSRRP